MSFRILCGDALTLLRTLPDESAECCVTSPPYWGLRDYGTAKWEGGSPTCDHAAQELRRGINLANSAASTRGGAKKIGEVGFISYRDECAKCGAVRVDSQIGLERTPEEYVSKLVEIFREVRRVLKNDGTLWLNLGDCYATGAGKVGDSPGGGEQGDRWKGFRGDRTDAKRNAGAIPLGPMTQPNRMPIPGLKPKDLVGVPWRVAFALRDDGWYLRSDIIWAKPNPMPESVLDRPTKAHEYVFLLSKSERYYYDAAAVAEPQVEQERTRRLKEQASGLDTVYTLRRDQPHGQVSPGQNGCARTVRARQELALRGTRNRRTVWTFATLPTPEAHFATFTIELAEVCILAGCRPLTGVVLDPFSGAATTGLAALKQGRNYLGIELNPSYIDISYARARKYYPLLVGEEVTA